MANPDSIRFFDTGSRTTVDLPTKDAEVGFYSCGPTVYKDAHIGNMRAYVTADLLRRAIKLGGGEPKQVINITDVGHLTSDGDSGDDKVAESAKERGVTAWEVAKEYEAKFWKDYDALGLERPEVIARATEHIDDQIALIQQLEAAGVTYQTVDGVYFDSTKFPDYAKFANLDLKGLEAGSRVELGVKQNASDFALWKFPQGPGVRDMQWDSPWGEGFPGWHIECSAMAMKYLGSKFDIHTGGIDHIPVHHTNEIAQAQAAGHDFADYWLHTEFLLNESGDKMSKSAGVSSRLPTVLRDYKVSVDALRYMYLTHHFQSPLEFGEDRVAQAATAHTRLLDTAAITHALAAEQTDAILSDRDQDESAKLWSEFARAIAQDNLNTPKAIDTIHRSLKAKGVSPTAKDALLEKMDGVLSLGITNSTTEVELSPSQSNLLSNRSDARTAKDFVASDSLREQLAADGLRVIDSPGGQVVRKL